jgi:hypothetical protein
MARVNPRQEASKADALSRWSARAQLVVGTTRHEFAYRWNAPRSAGARLVAAPLFLVTAVLVMLLGLFLLAALLVVGLVVAAALLASSFLRSRR